MRSISGMPSASAKAASEVWRDRVGGEIDDAEATVAEVGGEDERPGLGRGGDRGAGPRGEQCEGQGQCEMPGRTERGRTGLRMREAHGIPPQGSGPACEA